MWKIRSASSKEDEILTSIAAESEAYWGYDEEFMEIYKIIYNVTPEIISENLAYVLEDEGDIIGFYVVIQEAYLGEVEYFYIKPRYMGKGYGRIMWEHMIDLCESFGILEIELVTSPQAKEFYINMGAVVVSEVLSQVNSRKIPKLRCEVLRKQKK
ncbi:MAG: GNAT family N-acetyltransferase [Clostridium sp.]|uniref:GNAT family N-acetyltransferase n=1 Tax=Clostridium culturomicium TaxID=1499683 RepID=UPI002914C65E|nr:GNAT family N-acetyltransferase [Clostridium sp.]MDU7085880.1 GNAT family N-acetyltransferase [Clostridium sp.]